jgi:hypothetical protein
MAEFLTDLICREVSPEDWELTNPLVYQRDDGTVIWVGAGFITDFASVPKWLPVVYALLKNKGRKAAALHDKFYRQGGMSKEDADSLFLEALHACKGLTDAERHIMYYGVKMFGGFAYKGERNGPVESGSVNIEP